MGRTKTNKPGEASSGAQDKVALGERRNFLEASLAATLTEYTQRFNDILNAVLDIKTTLEHKIDALRINMGHLREDHKKLKERIEAAETTVSNMRLLVADATSHIKALQKEVIQLRQHVDQEGRS
ncbi:hypothetical protein NDU88_006584 [Pleurodeles waltl]|uniref:Uncharacterized protein n=1 Tax=Pleurodeles waltl TaxID=8319 RepID=A0AAV7LSZ9_PLEWA|nr:hypothetical protein NDU88_006584 [Pleurodeles waltl]